MSLPSLITLSLDALATGMSLVLLYRLRHWRLGGLSLLLGLITLSHA